MTTCDLFNSTKDDSKQRPDWVYIKICSLWAAGFTFGLSSSQRHGDEVMTPHGVTAPVLTEELLVKLSERRLPLPPNVCFSWGSHEGTAPSSLRSDPPSVLAPVPVSCSANPAALASHWATSLWLSDLAVCREGFRPHHSNWFILPPITHLFKIFDWPGLPRRRQSKGLWDEKWP